MWIQVLLVLVEKRLTQHLYKISVTIFNHDCTKCLDHLVVPVINPSFGNLFIGGNSNQNYTDFSSPQGSRIGKIGNITSVNGGDGLTGGGSSG